MKKIGDKPLTQTERTRRYYDKNELVLFSTRIEKKWSDRLNERLARYGKTKKQFVMEAIKRYLNRD